MSEDKKRIKRILMYRIRGFYLKPIGNILHLTKEGVRQIIDKNKNDHELKKL